MLSIISGTMCWHSTQKYLFSLLIFLFLKIFLLLVFSLIYVIMKSTIYCNDSITYNFCYCLVAKLCLALCNPMDYSPPVSSVHGISQARILEWDAISFSRGSSLHRDWTCVSCPSRQIFYYWATREAPYTLIPMGN